MTFQEKLDLLKTKMFDLISTKDITFLWNLDKRIEVNKFGKFNYHNFGEEIHVNNIWKFLSQLDENKIYTIIPVLSKNNTPDEPFIILSQTFLVTKHSSYILIKKYLHDKIILTSELYKVDEIDNLSITFKYKEVKIEFNEQVKFK